MLSLHVPMIDEYKKLFARLRDIVRSRGPADKISSILYSVDEQETSLTQPCEDKDSSYPSIEHRDILDAIRISGFFAGVISFLRPYKNASFDYETLWYHVHNFLFDSLDDNPSTAIGKQLLAALEMARGEMCDAYRLYIVENNGKEIPEECDLFLQSLDIPCQLLSKHFHLRMATKVRSHPSLRAKYSGDMERYAIDVRTYVLNDIRRYYPGKAINVPEKVILAIRNTYSERIEQLIPEDNCLLSGLIKHVPVLSFLLALDGFDPTKFVDEKLSFSQNDSPSWGYAWTVSLRRIFFSDDGQPSPVAQRTLERMEFGPLEMLEGILYSMSRPWGHAIRSEFSIKLRDASLTLSRDEITQEQLIGMIIERAKAAYSVDSSFMRQQLGFHIDSDGKICVLPFSTWSVNVLTDTAPQAQDTCLFRGNLVQDTWSLYREVIQEFEWLLNQRVPEQQLQEFLEKHPFLLLSLGNYSRVKPQLKLIMHEDSGKKHIPDFFLEIAHRRDSDIVELKLPSVKLDVRKRQGKKLSAKVYDAVSQLIQYREWFDSASNRNTFQESYGMKCFLPRGILIIGRSNDFQSDVDRISMEQSLPDWVSLKTYDDLARSARQWMQNVGWSSR